jgi:hypothetical protein
MTIFTTTGLRKKTVLFRSEEYVYHVTINATGSRGSITGQATEEIRKYTCRKVSLLIIHAENVVQMLTLTGFSVVPVTLK